MNTNKTYQFTKNDLKNFTKIYASNWHHVPRWFNPDNYQGKGIDAKIEQFLLDKDAINIKRETIHDLLLEHYHQNDENDTNHFVNVICELLDYPSQ
tara:strand:+ start:427 stop:714 length:288 start_codon:yes stop_codon:yes gene_type:complete